MSSSDYYYINILNNTIVCIYKYIVPIFYVVCNIGNFLSALVFFKKTWKKNVCVFYFKISLLVNSCYVNCGILGIIFLNGFNINLQNSNVVLCKVYFYISTLFAILSATILILASIDRLLISSQNVDTRLYSSKRLAYFTISISTVFWIVFNSHILAKVNLQEIYPSYFICYYDLSASYQYFVAVSSAVINVVFDVVMIILCIFAFKNVHRIRAVPREKRNQIRSMTKKDLQLLRCLFVQNVAFIIFSSSISIYYVYDVITKTQIQTVLNQTIHNFFNNFLTFIYDIYYSTSFFIFVIVSKAFRHELKRIIYKIIGKELTPLREEDNRQGNIERDNAELNVVSTIVLPA
jgi:hypothetical protein